MFRLYPSICQLIGALADTDLVVVEEPCSWLFKSK